MAGDEFSEFCGNHRWVFLWHEHGHRTVAGGDLELGLGKFYLTHVFVRYLHVPAGDRHQTVLSLYSLSSSLAHKLSHSITREAAHAPPYCDKQRRPRHSSISRVPLLHYDPGIGEHVVGCAGG